MGKRVFVAVLVCFLAGLGSMAISVRAQEKPQLWALWEFTVKPPKDEAYCKAVKDEVALMAKYKFPYSLYGYYVSEFRYEFATPLKNYGDIENLYKAYDNLAKKAGDEWKNLMKAYEGTYESYGQSSWYMRPDLSYEPASPRLKPEEEKFFLDDIWYIEPGKEAEFEAAIKDLLALWKNKGITERARAFICDIGPGMPVFVGSVVGKDRIDFWENNEKLWDKLGKEGEVIMNKLYTLSRKREWNEGWFLSELSYIAKEEKK
jgi:hypothetical protein